MLWRPCWHTAKSVSQSALAPPGKMSKEATAYDIPPQSNMSKSSSQTLILTLLSWWCAQLITSFHSETPDKAVSLKRFHRLKKGSMCWHIRKGSSASIKDARVSGSCVQAMKQKPPLIHLICHNSPVERFAQLNLPENGTWLQNISNSKPSKANMRDCCKDYEKMKGTYKITKSK